MLNTIYRLVAPRRIEAEFNDISIHENKILVRPTHLSICAADQRYYQGKRDEAILEKKLPMALIHEGIGKVVIDPKGVFAPGQTVVMVPNTPVEEDEVIGENYLQSSRFRSSGFDGFMQDIVPMDRDRVVCLPEEIDRNVASFMELISVCYAAIDRFLNRTHKRKTRIGIWGDGNIGYITALLLKKRLPDSEIFVFGKHLEKLNDFIFADGVYNIAHIPTDMWIDHAFECVGGTGSGVAVNQIIDYIRPEGTIALLGVSEDSVPIRTRMVLEKGLTLYGSSRSSLEDFQNTIDFLQDNRDVMHYLSILISNIMEIRTISDIVEAFDKDIQKSTGKTVLLWDK